MKIICIGRNYSDHIQELDNTRPTAPVVFLKPDSAILPPKQPFVIPDFASEIHYEVEVLVKIAKVGKHINKRFANNYYKEIGLGIDFTARNLQNQLKKQGLPWEKAKAFDGSAVIGEWLPKSQFHDLKSFNFSLLKNKSTVQQGNVNQMLWSIDEIIEYVSKYFTLKKGDVIFTGTPSGVGAVLPNDRLTGYIENTRLFSIQVK